MEISTKMSMQVATTLKADMAQPPALGFRWHLGVTACGGAGGTEVEQRGCKTCRGEEERGEQGHEGPFIMMGEAARRA